MSHRSGVTLLVFSLMTTRDRRHFALDLIAFATLATAIAANIPAQAKKMRECI